MIQQWIEKEAKDPANAKARVASGEPLAYVLGTQPFLTGVYRVTPDVLIPRPETETMVHALIESAVATQRTPERILEIGLGSGAIAVEMLKAFPHATAIATEWSPAAAHVGELNAWDAGVSDRLAVVRPEDCAHVFEPIAKFGMQFDWIISNPPYLQRMESEVESQVLRFEPHEALFPAEGLSAVHFYEKFAREGAQWLTDTGQLVAEIPHERAEQIAELFREHGWSVLVEQDLTRRPRWIVAKYGTHSRH